MMLICDCGILIIIKDINFIVQNGHKKKRTTESTSSDESITTSSAETAFDVMEGNDLSFLSASPASIHASSHLLQTSSILPSATPKYSVIDSSEPSRVQPKSSIGIEIKCLYYIFLQYYCHINYF